MTDIPAHHYLADWTDVELHAVKNALDGPEAPLLVEHICDELMRRRVMTMSGRQIAEARK